jgi:hypothetical protein
MPRPLCPPEENILRAIHTAFWDTSKNRWTSELFKGEKVSVSRLAILSMEALFAIFHAELDSPPRNRYVVGGGEINIGSLQQIALNYEHPIKLTVEEDPIEADPARRIEANPAHAEIPQNITKGLARKIIAALIIHYEQTDEDA